MLALVPAIERWAIRATVLSLSFALQGVGRGLVVTGNSLSLREASIQIVSECTTLLPSVLLAGAILAYPARATRKITGLAVGLALLWLYNAVRILALMFVLARYPALFDLVHVYLWQTLTVGVVAGLFALWLSIAERSVAA